MRTNGVGGPLHIPSLAAGLGISVLTLAASAQTFTWNNPAGGDWNLPGNWLPAQVPSPTGTAVLGGTSAYTVTVGALQPIGSLNLSNPLASLAVPSAGDLILAGLTGPGQLLVNANQGASTSWLFIKGNDAVLDGNIRLHAGPASNPSLARLAFWSGTNHSLGPNAVITGRGLIEHNALTNHGTILASGPSDRIEFPGPLAQGASGKLVAQSGGTLAFTGGTITGGLVQVLPGGLIAGTNATFKDLTIQGAFSIPSGQTLRIDGSVASPDGQILVNSNQGASTSWLFMQGSNTVLDAHIRLNAAPSGSVGSARLSLWSGANHTLGTNAVVTGRGYIDDHLTNHGTLSPGHAEPGKQIGELMVWSTHTLTPTAKVHIELAGPTPTQFDRLSGFAALNLNGTLTIDYANAWVPQGHERLEIIKADAINGEFAQVVFKSRLSPTGPEQVFYTPTSIIIDMCYADADASGSLTIDDFIAFQTNFALGLDRADCDQDTLLTIDDFICFQTRFAIGC